MRLLGFVNDVGERGGGTLVVEGTHELVRRLVERAPGNDFGKSSEVRAHLTATSSWFRLLTTDGPGRTDPLMNEGDEIDGVRVNVTELRGNAGDMVVMHPWVLHNIGVNRSRQPRMMMSHTVYAVDNPFC